MGKAKTPKKMKDETDSVKKESPVEGRSKISTGPSVLKESVSIEPFALSPDSIEHSGSKHALGGIPEDARTEHEHNQPDVKTAVRTSLGARREGTSGTISRGLECLSSTTPDILRTVYTDGPRHDTEDKPIESIVQRLRGATSSDITDMNVSFVLSDLLSPDTTGEPGQKPTEMVVPVNPFHVKPSTSTNSSTSDLPTALVGCMHVRNKGAQVPFVQNNMTSEVNASPGINDASVNRTTISY